MKTCNKCKTEKPKAEFSNASKSKDGLSTRCRSCHALYDKKYKDENRDKIADRGRKYRESSHEKIAAYRFEYAAKNAIKISEQRLGYRIKNKEAISCSDQEYRKNNKLLIAARARDYYAENKNKILASGRAYYASSKDSALARWRNRRALKVASINRHTESEIREIFDSQKGLCANCKIGLVKSGANKYHVDHIMPLSKGGSNDKYNLQCLCPSCNLRKSAKDPVAWASENGRLI